MFGTKKYRGLASLHTNKVNYSVIWKKGNIWGEEEKNEFERWFLNTLYTFVDIAIPWIRLIVYSSSTVTKPPPLPAPPVPSLCSLKAQSS